MLIFAFMGTMINEFTVGTIGSFNVGSKRDKVMSLGTFKVMFIDGINPTRLVTAQKFTEQPISHLPHVH